MSIHETLSVERKEMQSNGELPTWFTTQGYASYKQSYMYNDQTVKQSYQRIADRLSKHLVSGFTPLEVEHYRKRFFEELWAGNLCISTPVWNVGTNLGLCVSCSGQYTEDSVQGFYESLLESVILTKWGFGTSDYIGDIRPRGSKISRGGTASGVVPVFNSGMQAMLDISQGNKRRGAKASYIDLMHGDFDELIDSIYASSESKNIGINYYKTDLINLAKGDVETTRRFKKHMKLRSVHGKGYFLFVDRVNRLAPEIYKKHGLSTKASNLCTEIMLHSDKEHTYTCVLSSLNAVNFDSWLDDTVEVSTIFLDCVVSEFLQEAKDIPYLDKAVRFTEKGRAIGLGVLGFHTYLQNNSIPFESMDSFIFNENLFKHINEKGNKASKMLAEKLGEPEWCVGSGKRNTHLFAVAPTFNNAILSGGVSQGIEPFLSNTFEQTGSGQVNRVNPSLIPIMKERGKYNKETIDYIGIELQGSIQDVDWLDDHEKLVFKTAPEIDQKVVIDLAAARQKHIDQGQSLNLFFKADATEEYVAEVHCHAMFNEWIKSLYYMRSQPTSRGAKQSVKAIAPDCVACEA